MTKPKGGQRPGAGKPKLYGEDTINLQLRVPISKKDEIKAKFLNILKKYHVKQKK